VEALAIWLEASALGHVARASTWAYPVANLFHLLGLCLIIGPIGIVDVRMLGGLRRVPLVPLARALVPLAITGILLQVVSGLVLFAADATSLLRAPLMQAKLALISIALGNAVAFELLWRDRDPAPFALKAMAAGSLMLWLAVTALGRLIGYR
jgi:hypothetical protein